MVRAFHLCESHPGRLLTDHLIDVASRLSADGSMSHIAGIFHDIAKATEFFQDYLQRKPIADSRLKQHAHLGAYLLLQQLMPKVEQGSLSIQRAVLAFLMVACHHTGLTNALDYLPPGDEV